MSYLIKSCISFNKKNTYEDILVNRSVYFIFIKTIFIALNVIEMYTDASVNPVVTVTTFQKQVRSQRFKFSVPLSHH